MCRVLSEFKSQVTHIYTNTGKPWFINVMKHKLLIYFLNLELNTFIRVRRKQIFLKETRVDLGIGFFISFLTGHFPILKPPNASILRIYLVQKCWRPVFEALKLRNVGWPLGADKSYEGLSMISDLLFASIASARSKRMFSHPDEPFHNFGASKSVDRRFSST